MLEQSLLMNLSSPGIAENNTSQLRREYLACQNLFQAQPALAQQFLESQAASISEAVVECLSSARFTLPDRIVLQDQSAGARAIAVPTENREQVLGGLVSRLRHTDLLTGLRMRLLELEHSTNLAVSYSAIILRHAIAMHLVHHILPAGKSVQYVAEKKDDIPSIPLSNENVSASVLVSETDAVVVKEGLGMAGLGELNVPYVETVRGFYMPQWVAFDDQHHLLVKNLNEAKAHIIAMRRYLLVLQSAVELAPYMVTDDAYQQKRYGMLGQLVNQGRALAMYEVEEIIQTIKHRVSLHEMDRGFSLRLPYFNDKTLAVEIYHFDVIPRGRIMFVPAFVVLAVRAQGAKVAQDTRLNKSTRRHLLMELSSLEETFLR